MTRYTLRYNYRLRPSNQAEQLLESEWHRCRWVWNQLVTNRYNRGWEFLNGKDLTAARARIEWLRDGSQDAQAATLRVFRGKGRRKHKSKRDNPSLGYSRNGFAIRDGRLNVKGASIPVVWHRELPSSPSSVRIFRDSVGHWYASFVVTVERGALPKVDGGIGIDWGVKVAATTTDPDYDYHSPQHGKTAQTELARYQRMMARRKPLAGKSGSRGYKAAKMRTARAHKKVTRQRTHDARQWARKVVADHQLIAVENFKSKFLAKSTMARKSADQAVGQLKRELETYAVQAGRELVMVPPAYTTMTCADCLTIAKQRLALGERVFVCHACGLVADRDRNAAKVILATAERHRASVETVRHSALPSGELQRAS